MISKPNSVLYKALVLSIIFNCCFQFSTCHVLPENEIIVEDLEWGTSSQDPQEKSLSFRINGESFTLFLEPTEQIIADNFQLFASSANNKNQPQEKFRDLRPLHQYGKSNGTFYSVKGSDGTLYLDHSHHGIRVEGLIDDDIQLIPTEVLSQNGGYAHTIKHLKTAGFRPDPITDNLRHLGLPSSNQRSTNEEYRTNGLLTSNINQRPTRQNQTDEQVAFIEMLVIFDHENTRVYTGNYDNIHIYLGIFWNKVQKIFSQLENPQIRFIIAGAIIMKDRKEQPFIEDSIISPDERLVDVEKALNSLKVWLYDHKYELPAYDMVVVQTGLDLRDKSKQVQGIAGMGTLCQMYVSSLIAKDHVSLYTGILNMAHEIGHVMNADHDEKDGDPTCRSDDYNQYIMSCHQNFWSNAHRFSTCSITQIQDFLRSARCVKNNPKYVPLVNELPGKTLINKDVLCQKHFGEEFFELKFQGINSNCELVTCVTRHGHSESIPFVPDGISCDDINHTKICVRGKCVTNYAT